MNEGRPYCGGETALDHVSDWSLEEVEEDTNLVHELGAYHGTFLHNHCMRDPFTLVLASALLSLSLMVSWGTIWCVHKLWTNDEVHIVTPWYTCH